MKNISEGDRFLVESGEERSNISGDMGLESTQDQGKIWGILQGLRGRIVKKGGLPLVLALWITTSFKGDISMEIPDGGRKVRGEIGRMLVGNDQLFVRYGGNQDDEGEDFEGGDIIREEGNFKNEGLISGRKKEGGIYNYEDEGKFGNGILREGTRIYFTRINECLEDSDQGIQLSQYCMGRAPVRIEVKRGDRIAEKFGEKNWERYVWLFEGEVFFADGRRERGTLRAISPIHIELTEGEVIYPDGKTEKGKFEMGPEYSRLIEGERIYRDGTTERGEFKYGNLIKGERIHICGTVERGQFYWGGGIEEGEIIYSDRKRQEGTFDQFTGLLVKGVKEYEEGNRQRIREEGEFGESELYRIISEVGDSRETMSSHLRVALSFQFTELIKGTIQTNMGEKGGVRQIRIKAVRPK